MVWIGREMKHVNTMVMTTEDVPSDLNVILAPEVGSAAVKSPAWDWCEGLLPGEVDALLQKASRRTLSKGAKLFDLGAEAECIFLVRKGKIKLTLPLVAGDKTVDVMVGERQDGHLVGWSGLIPPHKFTVEASASEETDLFTLTRSVLQDLFSANPEVGYSVYSNLARIVGQRLVLFQAMWVREMQHVVSVKRF